MIWRTKCARKIFGPVANPDGSPTELTLEMMGFRRRVGDTFIYFPNEEEIPQPVKIIAFTATGVVINYVTDPIENDWEIPYSEAM